MKDNIHVLDNVSMMRLERDGAAAVAFEDGRSVAIRLDRDPFAATSAIRSVTVYPRLSQMQLETVSDELICIEMPSAAKACISDPGTPKIYLDQNHWSTITLAVYEPERVPNEDELNAAKQLIDLANTRGVVLPMSAAHMSETCKQVNRGARYRRALTIAQLSRGWQLRDPLHLRQLELRRALALRYSRPDPEQPLAVTLEPDALHSGRETDVPAVASDLPEDARRLVHISRCAAGNLDAMLDDEPVAAVLSPAWASSFQQFAAFIRDNPTGVEMKRRRTWAKFVADLGTELPRAAHAAGIDPSEMSDWARNHGERDVSAMASLGIFREVLHEKLSDPQLRWKENDLTDMIYLCAAAGYCDHVTAERAHASHIRNSLRRLDRTTQVHPNLRSLVARLQSQ